MACRRPAPPAAPAPRRWRRRGRPSARGSHRARTASVVTSRRRRGGPPPRPCRRPRRRRGLRRGTAHRLPGRGPAGPAPSAAARQEPSSSRVFSGICSGAHVLSVDGRHLISQDAISQSNLIGGPPHAHHRSRARRVRTRSRAARGRARRPPRRRGAGPADQRRHLRYRPALCHRGPGAGGARSRGGRRRGASRGDRDLRRPGRQGAAHLRLVRGLRPLQQRGAVVLPPVRRAELRWPSRRRHRRRSRSTARRRTRTSSASRRSRRTRSWASAASCGFRPTSSWTRSAR